MRCAICLAGFILTAGCVPPSARDIPPIIGAARSGNAALLEQLLAAGADPNVRAGVNDWTPLEHAIHKNQQASVEVLLARHADVNVRGGGGITPLIMAAGYGYDPIVRILLAAGADPKLKADNGVDALSAAVGGVPDIDRFTVGNCQTATVRTLLQADPSLALTAGFASRVARFAGCQDVIRLLDDRARNAKSRKAN